jgi:hypothetical protein
MKKYLMRSHPRTDKKLIFNYRLLWAERERTSALSNDLQDVTKKLLFYRFGLCALSFYLHYLMVYFLPRRFLIFRNKLLYIFTPVFNATLFKISP